MRSLHEEAVSKLPPGTDTSSIPSLRWMEFQFWPKNTLLNSAVQYTAASQLRI